MMHLMLQSPGPSNLGQTDARENITFLHLQAVISDTLHMLDKINDLIVTTMCIVQCFSIQFTV